MSTMRRSLLRSVERQGPIHQPAPDIDVATIDQVDPKTAGEPQGTDGI